MSDKLNKIVDKYKPFVDEPPLGSQEYEEYRKILQGMSKKRNHSPQDPLKYYEEQTREELLEPKTHGQKLFAKLEYFEVATIDNTRKFVREMPDDDEIISFEKSSSGEIIFVKYEKGQGKPSPIHITTKELTAILQIIAEWSDL